MRLLYVHETMGNLGGAEANVRITARELQSRGWTVGLHHLRSSGNNGEEWRSLFQPHLYDGARLSVPEVHQAFSPDVVYVHKWDHLDSLAAWAASGLPVVRMVHDHDIYCLRSYKYNVFTRRVCHRPATPWCVFPCLAVVKRQRGGPFPLAWQSYPAKLREIALNRQLDRHFVVTRYMQRELERNGFDPARIDIFPPVPRNAPPLASSFSDRNVLIYAGQLIRGKGVDLMLRALSRVPAPFELIILGDGNHRPHCERLARRLGLASRVRFAGFLPQHELFDYYREATAVLIPSVWPEPIATIGLEVMRCGLPVVAFDAGGISDWLTDGENGFLVPWMDLDAFARGVGSLLADKDLARRMGENGRARVARDYDFDAYVQRLSQTLARIAESKKTSA